MHTINEDIFKITFLPLMFSSFLKYQSAVYFNYFSISIERKLTFLYFIWPKYDSLYNICMNRKKNKDIVSYEKYSFAN